jgi:hypothetical protein
VPSCAGAATATDRAKLTTRQTASSTTPQRPRVLKHATPRLIDAQPLRSTYRPSLSHTEQPPCLAKPTRHVKIPSHPHHTHIPQPRREDLGQADPLHSVGTLKVGGSCAGTMTLRPPRRDGGGGGVVRDTAGDVDPHGEGGESAALSSMRIAISMCECNKRPRKSHLLHQEVASARGVTCVALRWSSGAGLFDKHVGSAVEEEGSAGMQREERGRRGG